MKMKKFLAVAMAATMVVGSGMTAMATGSGTDITSDGSGTITGSGTEAFANKNVMKVTVPTTLTNLFDYKIDPQGLVTETKNYDGTTVTVDEQKAPQGLVFKNAGNKISNESDPVTITNKSSIPVKMGITVTLTPASGGLTTSQLASSDEFATGKVIYLGLKSTNEFEKALDSASVTSANILLSGASQYAPKYESGSYKWAEKDNAKFSDFTFSLTGAIDKNVAYDTWATVDAQGNVTEKNPPAVSVKFDLTGVKDALPGGVGFDDGKLWFWYADAANADEDGELGETAPTSVTINGKSLTTISDAKMESGFVSIEEDKVFALFKSGTLTDAEKTAIRGYVKAMEVTFGSGANTVTYYGEVE